ncbi:MAG: hypothetical protein NTX15_11450 [Candidatus Kapabacteria bacterium]|nr:hypothetical protein [Candidatus Kapabacteria bacterium]
MNSFQIIQAKRFLVGRLSDSETKRISVEEALTVLNAAGYNVSLDILPVLILGSSTQSLAYSADGSEVIVLGGEE